MTLRDELIQVAAVAIAILTDLDQGDTALLTGLEGDRVTSAHRKAMESVAGERIRQESKWGAQHHPIAEWLSILGEEYGEACKAANDEVIFPKGAGIGDTEPLRHELGDDTLGAAYGGNL